MNLQQLQYISALAEYQHFEKAAEKCFISQSTLSTMISKFEDEIGIQVFDRKRKPVALTKEGQKILIQINRINKEINELNELTSEIKGEVKGMLSMAVIPTISPYLLPRFLHHFAAAYPSMQIEVREQTTSEIIRLLKNRELDIGIVSTPIHDSELIEYELYKEPFVYFDLSENHEKEIDANNIDLSNLCLLEEGHCMRTQVLSLCDYYEKVQHKQLNFKFKAGSIDSLLRFVKVNKASTLLPYLAAIELDEDSNNHLSAFSAPVPYRTVGLIVHQHFVKKAVLIELQKAILHAIKGLLPENEIEGILLNPLEKK